MRQFHFHYKIQLKYNFSLCFECFICVCLAIYCVRYCYTFRSNSIHAELNRVDITQINGCVRLNMQLILAIISSSMNPIAYFSVLYAIQFRNEKSMSCYQQICLIHTQEVYSSDPSFFSRKMEKHDTKVILDKYQITKSSKIGKNYLLKQDKSQYISQTQLLNRLLL